MNYREMVRVLGRDELEDWEERAAIMEYDGQLPREDAERLAYEDVMANKQAEVRARTRPSGMRQGELRQQLPAAASDPQGRLF